MKWLWLILAYMPIYALAEYFSKIYIDTSSQLAKWGSILCFVIGTFFWFEVLRENNQIALTSVVWLIVCMLTALGLGIFIFKEVLSIQQWVGIILAFISLCLLIK